MDKNTAQLRATFAKCCRTNKKAPIHKFRGNKDESGVAPIPVPYNWEASFLSQLPVGHWLVRPNGDLTVAYTLDNDKSWDAQRLGRAWRDGAMIGTHTITKIWFDELVQRRVTHLDHAYVSELLASSHRQDVMEWLNGEFKQDELTERVTLDHAKHFQDQREKDMDRLRDQMALSVTQPNAESKNAWGDTTADETIEQMKQVLARLYPKDNTNPSPVGGIDVKSARKEISNFGFQDPHYAPYYHTIGISKRDGTDEGEKD